MVVGELVASAMEMERRWRLGFGSEAQREERDKPKGSFLSSFPIGTITLYL
jgi:hypothetical protein